ncbi:MAG: radical SAM protein [Candidatus Fermentibacter sp.]|nr:radical SAM protein [Candidatus Fermentibacter sp.]
MNILGALPALMNAKQPMFLILVATARCNARCGFCFYADEVRRADPSSELTLDEHGRISKGCGRIPYLLLSGGEPVLREDLFEIIGLYISNAGVRYVNVPSNGLSPDRSEALFRKLTAGFPGVHFRGALSIDFPDGRHDGQRGVPGCLDKVRETATRFRALREDTHNFSMDVVSVYMPSNSGCMDELRGWVAAEIRPDNHEVHLLRPEWPSTCAPGIDPQAFVREHAKFRDEGRRREKRPLSAFFRALNNGYTASVRDILGGRPGPACPAGRRIVVLDEVGRLRLCEPRGIVLGNVRESGFRFAPILESRTAVEAIRSIRRERCTCTWECSLSTAIVFSPRKWLPLLAGTVRESMGRNRRR